MIWGACPPVPRRLTGRDRPNVCSDLQRSIHATLHAASVPLGSSSLTCDTTCPPSRPAFSSVSYINLQPSSLRPLNVKSHSQSPAFCLGSYRQSASSLARHATLPP